MKNRECMNQRSVMQIATGGKGDCRWSLCERLGRFPAHISGKKVLQDGHTQDLFRGT